MTQTEATPVSHLEHTFRDQRPALLRLAYLMCGSPEQAEDLVQSAFAAAHQRWAEIDDHAAYLKRTIINQAKDGQRRQYRYRRLLPRLLAEQVTFQPEIDHTWSVIRTLPVTQRTVVVLHYYEDLALVEIAALLDRSPSTVRSDLRRAHDRLRKALS